MNIMNIMNIVETEIEHIKLLQKGLLQKFPQHREKIESRCMFYRQMLSIIKNGLQQCPDKYMEDIQPIAILERARSYCDFILTLDTNI